jgi:hypothetical protein
MIGQAGLRLLNVAVVRVVIDQAILCTGRAKPLDLEEIWLKINIPIFNAAIIVSNDIFGNILLN